jgi:hypothetical protein
MEKQIPLRKKETAEEIELVDGSRVLYYPYIDPPSQVPGVGRPIGELENGEQVFQYAGITREEAEYLATAPRAIRDNVPQALTH